MHFFLALSIYTFQSVSPILLVIVSCFPFSLISLGIFIDLYLNSCFGWSFNPACSVYYTQLITKLYPLGSSVSEFPNSPSQLPPWWQLLTAMPLSRSRWTHCIPVASDFFSDVFTQGKYRTQRPGVYTYFLSSC